MLSVQVKYESECAYWVKYIARYYQGADMLTETTIMLPIDQGMAEARIKAHQFLVYLAK